MTPAKVRAIIANQFANSDAFDAPDSTTVAQLGADSLDALELAMALEEAFGITISDDEVTEPRTIGEVVALVEAKVAARGEEVAF